MKRAELNKRKENFLKEFNKLLNSYNDIVFFEKDVKFEQCDGWYEAENEFHDFTVDFRNIKTEEDIAEEKEEFEKALKRKEERKNTLVNTYEGKKAIYKGITYCNIHIVDLEHFEGNVVTIQNGREHISRNKQTRKVIYFSDLKVI